MVSSATGTFRVALLLSLLAVVSCTWMSSDTVSAIAGDPVVSQAEAKSYLTMAIVQGMSSCPTLVRPGLMMIDQGFPHSLGRPFYHKDSLDLCAATILSAPCPAGELGNTEAMDYYRWVLSLCNPRPYEP